MDFSPYVVDIGFNRISFYYFNNIETNCQVNLMLKYFLNYWIGYIILISEANINYW